MIKPKRISPTIREFFHYPKATFEPHRPSRPITVDGIGLHGDRYVVEELETGDFFAYVNVLGPLRGSTAATLEGAIALVDL